MMGKEIEGDDRQPKLIIEHEDEILVDKHHEEV